MPADYNSIANIYDLLSRIVFGRQIIAAQVCLIKYIPTGGRILIVGGGTGWILAEIANAQPGGLIIDYVELSEKMMALSRKRNCGGNQVNFIQSPVEDWNFKERYDVIFTPFIFDNFKAEKAGAVFNRLHSLLPPGGTWLFADFVYDQKETRLWQKILLKIMYLFFRITTGIETLELVPMDAYFKTAYQKEFEAAFYFDFIRARAFKKV